MTRGYWASHRRGHRIAATSPGPSGHIRSQSSVPTLLLGCPKRQGQARPRCALIWEEREALTHGPYSLPVDVPVAPGPRAGYRTRGRPRCARRNGRATGAQRRKARPSRDRPDRPEQVLVPRQLATSRGTTQTSCPASGPPPRYGLVADLFALAVEQDHPPADRRLAGPEVWGDTSALRHFCLRWPLRPWQRGRSSWCCKVDCAILPPSRSVP
jgi:hypothetical protein